MVLEALGVLVNQADVVGADSVYRVVYRTIREISVYDVIVGFNITC